MSEHLRNVQQELQHTQVNKAHCTCQANESGAPNENIVQNHLDIALLNVF